MAASSSSSSPASSLKPGTIVHLHELRRPSPFFTPCFSLRVMGRLQSYDIETGMAEISESGASLKVSTEYLRDLHFRTGSLYQFIGELTEFPGSSTQEMFLQARVGRNVDGLDVRLYDKALELRRQFEAKHLNKMQR